MWHMSDNQSMTLLLTILVLVGIGAFDALALKFGADTRPGFDERKHRF
jgi:hypothetical protein